MRTAVICGFGNNRLKFGQSLHNREPWAGSQESLLSHSLAMWPQANAVTSLGLLWDHLWSNGAASFPHLQIYLGFPCVVKKTTSKTCSLGVLTPQVLVHLVPSLCSEGMNSGGSAFSPPPWKAPQYACQLVNPTERVIFNVVSTSQTACGTTSVQLLGQYHSHGLRERAWEPTLMYGGSGPRKMDSKLLAPHLQDFENVFPFINSWRHLPDGQRACSPWAAALTKFCCFPYGDGKGVRGMQGSSLLGMCVWAVAGAYIHSEGLRVASSWATPCSSPKRSFGMNEDKSWISRFITWLSSLMKWFPFFLPLSFTVLHGNN